MFICVCVWIEKLYNNRFSCSRGRKRLIKKKHWSLTLSRTPAHLIVIKQFFKNCITTSTTTSGCRHWATMSNINLFLFPFFFSFFFTSSNSGWPPLKPSTEANKVHRIKKILRVIILVTPCHQLLEVNHGWPKPKITLCPRKQPSRRFLLFFLFFGY